jgi:diguanylate cyclase (GGDEF)-like protein
VNFYNGLKIAYFLIPYSIKSIRVMSHHQALPEHNSITPDLSLMSKALQQVLHQAQQTSEVEQTVAFGYWWFEPKTGHMILSQGAAKLLEVATGFHALPQSAFLRVKPDDIAMLMPILQHQQSESINCELRIINAENGLHWLRFLSLSNPEQNGLKMGVVQDVTTQKHAMMRENFSFASSQFLVGAHSIGMAVTKVIQLVCETLGWEWGAYWSIEQCNEPKLICKHYWSHPEVDVEAFTAHSLRLSMGAGEGLVGSVWHSALPSWIEDMANDPQFLRRHSAKQGSLKSGYAFPISYMTVDGRRHSVGVMEFFSQWSRQREAQLPNLASTIGALIAQAIQRMEQQESIKQLAQIDDLTGLINRNYFHQLLDSACFNATANTTSFGVLFIDLDRFKPINDAFGHDAGNVVLRAFAQRLQQLVQDKGIAGRLGGDEFVVLTKPTETMRDLRVLAEQVLVAARTPFAFGEHELTVSASVGISIFPENGWTSAELVRSADTAMYKSKKNGRNVLSFVSDDSCEILAQERSLLVRQLTLEAELHHALVKNHFFLEYQPVFDFNNIGARLVAVEALIRWRRADGEIIHPDVFIPIAEQSRLIIQIGRWVMNQACHDLAILHKNGFSEVQLSVNMAALEFVNPSLPYELSAIADSLGIANHFLCLEMTESMIMRQPDKVIPVMKSLTQIRF